MSKAEVKKRIENLKKLINRYRYEYHVLDNPSISDAVNDSLKHELQELERQNPEFVTPDSPTQRVGGQPLEKFQKVTHSRRMISLEDIFSFQELKDWEVRNKKLEPNGKYDYWCEVKIDGFAIALAYQDGVLQTAATRGDGFVGEDVTNNVKTIESIPLKLDQDVDGVVEVRGEIYMTLKEFERINKEQVGLGEKTFANPRNLAAGSIRQLDPKIAASRKLDFYGYELLGDLKKKTKEEEVEFIKKLGFKTIPFHKHCKNLEEVESFFQSWKEKRNDQEFGIDGLVVKINDNTLRDKLGVVGKAPRGMVAYKFPAEQVTTVVKQVDWNVGRTGVLTPLATFEPVNVAGTIVQHATLHNLDEIQRLGVKIGDTVVIEKAGDIIPKVVQVLKDLRTGDEKTISVPKKCPVCASEVVRHPDEVALYCSNDNCYAKEIESIKHFVGGMDILGLGDKIVEQLAEVGLLKKPADLYKLKIEDLLPLERFAEKSAQKVIDAIQSKKKVPLERLIWSLGIRHVGTETAIDLARYFGSIDKLSKASLEDLQNIRDVGEVMAQSILEYFADKQNIDHLKELLKYIEPQSPKKIKNVLGGKTFVVTGTLEKYGREEVQNLIRELGGNISGSVSKKTDYVLAGEEAGSKLDKAKELGIKVLSEEEFLYMINKN